MSHPGDFTRSDALDLCTWAEGRLDDFFDDSLTPAECRKLETHLVDCDTCREQHEAFGRLLATTAELPRSIEPGDDLWPAIAEHLDDIPRAIPLRRQNVWQAPWWQQVAAALVFTLLGSALAGGYASSSPVTDPDIADDAGSTLADAINPTDGSYRRASSSGEAFVIAEAEYLRAKEGLWLAVYEHRDELSPLQLKLVERNLEVIDDAIRDLRQALEGDPGNPQLQRLVLASHRRGLDLLWSLVKHERA